jgi:hypothetical protein
MRYGIALEDVRSLVLHLRGIKGLPVLISHPILERLHEVDV